MKYNIDEAILILQDYIETDRIIRDGDTESDYSKYCQEKVDAIESLIEYVYASQSALKTYKSKDTKYANNNQLTDEEIKQLIVCLNNAIYKEDEFISYEQRLKLIKYNYNLPYRLYELLCVEHCEGEQSIDIDTLEIREY